MLSGPQFVNEVDMAFACNERKSKKGPVAIWKFTQSNQELLLS